MAENNARHARLRASKDARRRAVVAQKKAAAMPPTLSLSATVRAAASAPVWKCLANPGLFDTGIGNVIFSRKLPSGTVAGACFLVDTYCLGVKDVVYREASVAEYERFIELLSDTEPLQDADPAMIRKLVNAAAAYAADLGLPPAPDFRVVEALFGDIDASSCVETFEFGKDGKPFYVAGPNDTPARARRILNTLAKRLGPEGFHYMAPIG